jgi:acetyl esterase/lipase
MNRKAFSFAVVLSASLFASASLPRQQDAAKQQAPASQSASSSVSVQENVVYATIGGVELHLDVYQPSERGTTLRPGVILIHGGGWTDLDKSTMRKMGQFLGRSGYVAFSVDYRLFDGTKNTWPAQLDDVQRAVRWIRANAAKYGVNPDHIGAFGHSAGAQLAALLGMEDTRDNSDASLAKYSSKVQAVVAVSTPTDFTLRHGPDLDEFQSKFFAADYGTHPEVWRDASPVFHVSKNTAPFLIVHGTQDEAVPISQSQELYDKLQAAGVAVSFIKVNDAHTFHTPEARRQLAFEALAFFNRTLVPSP